MKQLKDLIVKIANWPCWEAFFWGFVGAVFMYLITKQGHH